MRFEEADLWKSYFYIEPPPQPVTPSGAQWTALGTVMNNFKFITYNVRRCLHIKELDCSTAGSGENDA